MLSIRERMFRGVFDAAVAVGALGFAIAAHADPIPQGWEASNMEPVG